MLRNQKGQALLQVMVTAAITVIIMLAMVQAQLMQVRENKALGEKLGSIEFGRTITNNLVSTHCNLLFNPSYVDASTPLTFNSAHLPYTINFTQAWGYSSGGPASATAPSLALNPVSGSPPGIQLVVSSTSSATLNFTFDKTKLVRSIHDYSFALPIQTSGPANATTITGCGIGGQATNYNVASCIPTAGACAYTANIPTGSTYVIVEATGNYWGGGGDVKAIVTSSLVDFNQNLWSGYVSSGIDDGSTTWNSQPTSTTFTKSINGHGNFNIKVDVTLPTVTLTTAGVGAATFKFYQGSSGL